MAQEIIADCGGCRFFLAAPAAMKNTVIGFGGECRRFPKVEMKQADDWCGEHQPRPAAAKGKGR